MTQQEKAKKYFEIMMKDEIAAQFKETKRAEDVQRLFSSNGLNVTLEETEEIVGAMVNATKCAVNEEGELSEEALDSVVGGIDLRFLARKTWDLGMDIAGKVYWGSRSNAEAATASFWGNVINKGWNYAVRNVHNY